MRYRQTGQVVLTFFGDGATSEGDFHEGLNFAAVFQTPTIFLCQNNHWAISVPRCHNMVEAHGGTLYFASQPGRGTTVRVTLPSAASDGPSLKAPPAPVAPAQGQGEAILLIDDEPGVQKALGRVLQWRGHDVTVANNGREGLAALEERSYAVILCDMRMPDLDGPGFYRQLEHRHPHPVSRIILLTGNALSPEAQAFFTQIDCPRLIKPFSAKKVRQVIQQVLDER